MLVSSSANFTLCFLIFIVFMVFPATAMCGRRGSPAYRIAEDIFYKSAEHNLGILRCFLERMRKGRPHDDELSLEPTLFFNCVLQRLGVGPEERNNTGLTEQRLEDYQKFFEIKELHSCINTRMSCPEAQNMVICKKALDANLHTKNLPEESNDEINVLIS